MCEDFICYSLISLPKNPYFLHRRLAITYSKRSPSQTWEEDRTHNCQFSIEITYQPGGGGGGGGSCGGYSFPSPPRMHFKFLFVIVWIFLFDCKFLR